MGRQRLYGSGQLVRGAVAHALRDLGFENTGGVPVTHHPIGYNVWAMFTDVASAGQLLAEVWESGLSGCQDVAYLEKVLCEYRKYEKLLPRERADADTLVF